ncbi:hypothetical protein BDW59DRAFT_173475 [Aspergillus cavernicola]|uniref:F-box domain-containing protein n=1 Tax=Aspergillus cavernicola TaxID=176166 RepID=A0ABR4I9D0_9EURO
MGCRGIWNFHINDNCGDKPDSLEGWGLVLFPSPIHSNLDYVYTVDQDAGAFIISLWNVFNGPLKPTAIRIDLARIYESFGLLIKSSLEERQYMFDGDVHRSNLAVNEAPAFGTLDIDFDIPNPMNELEERLFTNFTFVLSIAFLRLAARDFELSSLDCNDQLPISFASIPTFNCPKTDIHLFHGFLIVSQEDVEAKSYIDGSFGRARLILISPNHVTFVEYFHRVILASDIDREKWTLNIPPETFQKILHEMDPRDAVAFLQASFTARQCYYTWIPQFKDTVVGKNSVCCPKCYAWRHLECVCVGVENRPSNDQYIYLNCQENTQLSHGGINRYSYRKSREGCPIRVEGSEKVLQLRLTKPSHLQPHR